MDKSKESSRGETHSDTHSETEQDNRTEEEKILETLDKLSQENDELKDKALRAHAEMENLRRRTAREMQDTRAYAVAGFAKAMLDVSDNLQRAIDAVPDEKRQEGSDEFKALIEGVEMTQRQMTQNMEANGVKRFNPLGERFDPNFHQAMLEVDDPNQPNNSVAQVMQEGYMIAERVLRPAMVAVAKGGPNMVEENEKDNGDGADGTDGGDGGDNEDKIDNS